MRRPRWLRWPGSRKRQYAGAKTTNSTGAWAPTNADVNTIVGMSASTLRARARQLVRDMPHAARACSVLQNYVVGPGLTLQSRVVDATTNRLNEGVNRRIEDAWKYWCDEADIARRLHLNELMSLNLRQQVEAGEAFMLYRSTRGAGRYLPLAVQLIEADYLGEWTTSREALPGNEIWQGVEYDPRTGRTQAYHFTEDASLNPMGRRIIARRIDARYVNHAFEPLRPNQFRGVTAFAPAVLTFHALRDYLEAEIDASRLSARVFAWYTSENPTALMGGMGAATDSTDASRKIEEVGTAIKEYLKTGESVTVHTPARPGQAFEPFTRFVLRTLAAMLGISYELLSGDFSGLSYSVQKGSRVAFTDQVRVMQARFIRQVAMPLYREFLDWAVLTRRLELPGYERNPWPYYRVTWLGPGMDSIDPLREGKADIERMNSLLDSPQRILLRQGIDPEEMLNEHQQWRDMLAARGLEPKPVSTALANNPAAVDPDTSEMGDGGESDEDAVARALLRRVK